MIRYYCTTCDWFYVDNLTAAATTYCPKCFGASFSTKAPERNTASTRFWPQSEESSK